MKRTLSLLLLALFGLALVAPGARAQEDDATQLEFVRRLRERHLTKLALEYLDKLSKTGSPAVKKMVPVEGAGVKVAMARDLEPDKRQKLLDEARQALEQFANTHAGTPEAAQARLEKARIASLEAQALFSQARRVRAED